MLYLVLEGMLKVSISERMSAREILDALTQMCTKLEDDPAYSVLCNKNPTSDPTLKHDNVLMSDPMEMVGQPCSLDPLLEHCVKSLTHTSIGLFLYDYSVSRDM
jgi:hypothetical protein